VDSRRSISCGNAGDVFGGRIVILPAMLVAMLRHREEYPTCRAETDQETP
jgi:hypothetical protein